jgi:hypothetical protein
MEPPVILAGRDLFLPPKHRFPTQKLMIFSPNTIFFIDIRGVSLDFSTTKSKIQAVEGEIGSFAGNFRSSRRQNRLNMTYCHMAKGNCPRTKGHCPSIPTLL